MGIENIDYRKLVTDIQKEIESLEILEEDTTRRLARLRQSLIGLAPLADQQDAEMEGGIAALTGIPSVADITVTDSARQILQAADKPLTPIQLKNQLVGMGKDFSGQKNVMASVHSLIRRLRENDEIETKDNGLTYSWKWRNSLAERMQRTQSWKPLKPLTSDLRHPGTVMDTTKKK